jgi:hypothetical protein
MDILSDFSKQTEGKGHVSLFKMREEGIIPDFIEHGNADETGRFCIAAFHQMHCLVCFKSKPEKFSGMLFLHKYLVSPSIRLMGCARWDDPGSWLSHSSLLGLSAD